MSEPRFIVTELVGYPITTSSTGSSHRGPTTDLYVQDTHRMFKVLGTFAPKPNGHPTLPRRRFAARELCDELNAWWEQELTRG